VPATDGESLASRLRRERVLPEADALEFARQIAVALDAAHRTGIVHRDLKPDNVFLVPDEHVIGGLRVKILDFGIAKLGGDGGATAKMKTRTGAVMGTPAYMAPEQCRGAGAVDHRADIYSLGCILYEMLAGRPPFVGEGLGDVLAAHIYEAPVPVDSVASVSPPVAALITSLLAKKPDERPSSMADVSASLGAMLGRPSAQRAATPAPSGAYAAARSQPSLATLSRATGELSNPGGAKSRSTTILLAVAGIVLVGGVAVAVVATRKPRDLAPATAKDSTPPVPSPTPAAPPPPAPIGRIRIVIDSTPQDAEVFRASDGVLVGKTPLTDSHVQGAGKAVYLVKYPGYDSAEVSFDLDKDTRTLVELQRPKVRNSRGHASRTTPSPAATTTPSTATPSTPKATEPERPKVKDAVLDPFDK